MALKLLLIRLLFLWFLLPGLKEGSGKSTEFSKNRIRDGVFCITGIETKGDFTLGFLV